MSSASRRDINNDDDELRKVLYKSSVVSIGLFAGVAVAFSVSVGKALTTEIGQQVFRKVYDPAKFIQVPLYLVGAGSSLGLYYLTQRKKYAVAGLLALSVPLFTAFMLLPINKQLMEDVLSPVAAMSLLRRWLSLHNVRTGLSLAALACAV
eukprot:TRINITY_DN1005_c0_g3_i1.p1 TRINITY_DN1005_c0_g3~~TRINITY_DN1005_c0_g3_i1.p1  ORF type:complete len:164 (-),score=30.55 TRINITY_DN1005_c0_g3_i1:240-692(-)